MSKKVVLLTGISGQDGSNMADLLLSKDYRVFGLIRHSSNPSNTNIKHLIGCSDFELVHGDLTDAGSLSRAVQLIKPDELYNFGAMSFVKTSFEEPINTYRINTEGVANLLESIRLFSPKTKFYQASTSEQFGFSYSTRIVNGLTEKFQSEETPMVPQSPYGAAKLASHAMVGVYRRGYGLFACCGILFNHEGCRRQPIFATRKITKYIGDLIKSGIKDFISYPKLRMGNISAYRDWGESCNYVYAAYLMLQQESPDDYVIATGEAHTVKEFLEEAFSYVGLNWETFVEIDPSLYRAAEVDFLRGDASKAKRILGWEPTVKFKDLVKIMVNNDLKKDN